MPYNSKQAAVDALKPGYRVVGEAPYTVKVQNPDAGLAGQPAQIDQQQGIVLSILGPKGEPDTIVVKEVGNNPNTKGGVGFDVIQGPQNKPTATATPSTQLTKLDANGNVIPPGSDAKAAVIRDDSTGSTFQVTGDTTTDPSTWTPIYDPNDTSTVNRRVIGMWDPANNKIGASVSAQNAKPSGQYTNLIDPNDPNGKRVIGLVDTGDKSIHPVSTTADGKQVVTTPTAIYSFDKDTNALTKLTDVDPKSPFQAVILDGKVYKFDPKDGSFTLGPVDHPDIRDAQNNPMVWQADENGGGKYVYAPGVSPAATIGQSTTLKQLVWYDNQGNVVAQHDNPNYVPTQPTQGTQSTSARMIQQWNPDTGKWDWVENQGRITASEALRNMASTLSGQVVAGDISQDEAVQIINAANSRMTNDINAQNAANTAATSALDLATRGAQTGAGMLQQRAQSAQNIIQQVLGLAGQGQHYGGGGGTAGLSGGMLAAPAGIGQMLAQGAQNYSSELLGGQSTMDAAARMVQAADPNSSLFSPTSQAAVGVLNQMFDKYQQLNGGTPHPMVAAQAAATQSANTGGMTVPQTTAVAPAPPPAPTPGVSMTPNQVNMAAMPGFGGGGQSTPLPNTAVQNATATGAGVGGMFRAPVTSAPTVNINLVGAGG